MLLYNVYKYTIIVIIKDLYMNTKYSYIDIGVVTQLSL